MLRRNEWPTRAVKPSIHSEMTPNLALVVIAAAYAIALITLIAPRGTCRSWGRHAAATEAQLRRQDVLPAYPFAPIPKNGTAAIPFHAYPVAPISKNGSAAVGLHALSANHGSLPQASRATGRAR